MKMLLREMVQRELGITTEAEEFSIPCPFHNDHNPSLRFYLTEEEGSFYCFGCQKSGSPARFIMLLRGLSYWEALDYIRIEYGVDLRGVSHTAQKDKLLAENLKFLLSLRGADFLSKPEHYRAVEMAVCHYLRGNHETMKACFDRAMRGKEWV